MSKGIVELTREVYFNRNGIVLLIALILAGFLAYLSGQVDPKYKEVLVALSTGVMASTIFASLQAMLTSLKEEELISRTIQRSIGEALEARSQADSENKKLFYPARVFEASNAPDPNFNREINKNFASTSRYYFRGMSGRYTIARLYHISRVFDELHLILPNPSSQVSFQDRLAAGGEGASAGANSLEKRKDEFKKGLLQSVVGGRMLASKSSRFQVHFQSDPIIDRIELFDDCLYITLFSDISSATSLFPRTLKFSNSALWYESTKKSLVRYAASNDESLVLRTTTGDEELVGFLREHGVEVDEKDLAIVLEDFVSFATGMKEVLG